MTQKYFIYASKTRQTTNLNIVVLNNQISVLGIVKFYFVKILKNLNK